MDDINEAFDYLKGESEMVTKPIPRMTDAEYDDTAERLEEFGFDDRILGNFDPIVRYLWARNKGYARKGLCIMGTVGTGKTLALGIIGRVIPATIITARYKADEEWYKEFLYGYYGTAPHVSIDDLGAEPIMNNYGVRLEVMSEVICARVRMYVGHKSLTHITTNLTREEMDERYGPRLFSRITEMCNIVIFEGPDRRDTGNEEFMESPREGEVEPEPLEILAHRQEQAVTEEQGGE